MPRFSRRRPPRKKFGARLRLLWRLAKIGFIAALLLIVAASYYMKRLDRVIAEKFDQQRKWNLPSRVFSDAEYLYPGMGIDEKRLIAKLDRLAYRDVGAEIQNPGDYARRGTTLDIFLHDFDYPTEQFKGFELRLQLNGNILERLENRLTGESLSLARLEPEMIASIFDERMEDRTEVTLQDLPPELLEAIVAIEDERFFRHSGVDPIGILRAMAANARAGRIVQGGSTLTQQLVKNFFLHSKKSYLRKLNEALMALQIERRHTKAEILQAYVNEIYLGQRGASSIAGVAEAAKYYFAKRVGQLTLAESALLAGMIRSPNSYSPFIHLERAKSRRQVVLDKMREDDLITSDEHSRALDEPIVLPKHRIRAVAAPYFIDFVKQELQAFYPQEILESEGLRIFTTLQMDAQIAAEEIAVEELARLEKTFKNLLPQNHAEPLQACLIAIQPTNGYIRAMVGGRDYTQSQFNRCTQGLRQPGSTFKPFVYLTAFDPKRAKKFFTPASLIEDTAFSIESGGEDWSPQNYDKEEHGIITVRTALEQSYNIATSKLALEAGLENVVATARDAGITSPLVPVPSIALGAFEVTPLEMAGAYTIFANGGIRAEAFAIMSVVTKDGEHLERRTVKMKRKFEAPPVYLTTNILKGVIDRGTGQGARALGLTGIVAGKTGTTSSYRDAWFVGFTPELLALSWVGYDDNAEMKMSGARAALPMWTAFMKRATPPTERDFSSPRNIVLLKVDRRTGGTSNHRCPDGFYEAFIEGTEPTQSCDDISLPEQVKAHAPSPEFF